MITISEILEAFQEALTTELASQGLAEWSINCSSNNLKEVFAQLSSEDIHDLLNEIYEGLALKISVDISEQLTGELEEILRTRKLMQREASSSDED